VSFRKVIVILLCATLAGCVANQPVSTSTKTPAPYASSPAPNLTSPDVAQLMRFCLAMLGYYGGPVTRSTIVDDELLTAFQNYAAAHGVALGNLGKVLAGECQPYIESAIRIRSYAACFRRSRAGSA
jgi:hypothetical protein